MKKMVLLLVILSANICIAQSDIYDVCRRGRLSEIMALYRKNPDCINKTTKEGYTPLILACYYGNEEAVRFLIDKVDDVNVTSDYGTPLMAATVKGNENIVKMLLDKNADTSIADANGTTALHYAVMLRHYDIIELLIEANANVDLKDKRNQSAMDYALRYDDKKLTSLLR